MRVVVVGYDKMFSNLILGTLESQNKIVGVFRHERVTLNPFLLFIKDIFALPTTQNCICIGNGV